MGSPLAVRVNVSAKSGRCGYGQVSAWRCFDEGKNKTPAECAGVLARKGYPDSQVFLGLPRFFFGAAFFFFFFL
jgi:hypothetical protein